mgnify:CR=1 FL=1|jgi:putative heme degradation protein
MNHSLRVITGSKCDSYRSKPNSLVSSREADVIQTRPLQPNWKRIISDLELYGPIKIITSNLAAKLCYQTVFGKVIDKGNCCLIDGQDFQLKLDQKHLIHATLVKNNIDDCYKSLRFLDFSKDEQLRFDLSEKSHIDRFYCSLIKHWSKPNTPKLIHEHNDICRLERIEQLLGCKKIDVQSDKRASHYSLVDGEDFEPKNTIPLLETLVDQYSRFHVWTGNKSVHTRYEHQFFDFEHTVDNVKLWSQKASLDLDFSKIAKSKVCARPENADKKDVLLYDFDGRCIATLGISQYALSQDKAIWKKMLKELMH